jgi:hypothetical protein
LVNADGTGARGVGFLRIPGLIAGTSKGFTIPTDEEEGDPPLEEEEDEDEDEDEDNVRSGRLGCPFDEDVEFTTSGAFVTGLSPVSGFICVNFKVWRESSLSNFSNKSLWDLVSVLTTPDHTSS